MNLPNKKGISMRSVDLEKQTKRPIVSSLKDHSTQTRDQRLERRQGEDRRRRRFRGLIKLHSHYRRRHIRRHSDQYTTYLDWHKPRYLVIALAIMLLSCMDAVLTVRLLQHGSIELNPFMAALIDTNMHFFVAIKMALTGVAVILFAVHSNFRVFRTFRIELFLYVSFILYLGLMMYEIMLISRLPDFDFIIP
jgi:hypothetical protein